MVQLAIKGHKTRGGEVIQLLEMLGGKSNSNMNGYNDDLYYFIAKDGLIYGSDIEYEELNCKYTIFTLEEFLEKFPYKVGDKVNSPCKGCIKTITSMWWDTYLNTITYKLDHRIYTNIDQLKVVNDLQPYKEEGVNLQELERKLDEALAKETAESLNKWLDGEHEPEPKAPILSNRYDYAEGKCGYVIPDGYEFDCIKEGFQTEIILKPKQPQYPKTYEECEKILRCFSSVYVDGYKTELLEVFQKLLICRDAYWKIAGAEMGLDEPWKPDWSTEYENKYVIEVYRNNVRTNSQGYSNTILAFPTKEMRDAFCENFKDLIEECKALL